MIFSRCYNPRKGRRATQPGARSGPWTEVAAARAPYPASAGARGRVRKTARLPAGPAPPVKGKEIRDLPSRLLRQRVWRRQLPGYARAGLLEAPGPFRPGPPSLSRKQDQAGARTRDSVSRVSE